MTSTFRVYGFYLSFVPFTSQQLASTQTLTSYCCSLPSNTVDGEGSLNRPISPVKASFHLPNDKMPHAEGDQDAQYQADEELISKLLTNSAAEGGDFDFATRDLEIGEKADDAVDYEDIADDDDLPEEELPTAPATQAEEHDDLFGDGGVDDDDEFADLFNGPSSDLPAESNGVDGLTNRNRSPTLTRDDHISKPAKDNDLPVKPPTQNIHDGAGRNAPPAVEEEEESEEAKIQRSLFAQAKQNFDDALRRGGLDPNLSRKPEFEDFAQLERIWPTFDRDEYPPHFARLFPPKRAHYIGKKPLKMPKPIAPTKVNLDLEPDQERAFKLHTGPSRRKRTAEEAFEQGPLIFIEDRVAEDNSDEEYLLPEVLDDQEEICGVTMGDLRILCEDWENIGVASPSSGEDPGPMFFDSGIDMTDDQAQPAIKRRKLDVEDLFKTNPTAADFWPSFDDPEKLTAIWSKRVELPEDDQHLRLDFEPTNVKPTRSQKIGSEMRKDVSGSVTKYMEKRFDMSNDKAYDLLKDNHSHRQRSTLGEFRVDHSMPALKLQYPFYKTTLTAREARSFHRPPLDLNKRGQLIRFEKLHKVKAKNLKGVAPEAIFQTAKDLSMGDNSHVLLLEYSEVMPMILSNFGMGNKIVNYYRRKDDEDTSRPKLEIGETSVLLPQDKSPFSLFGQVDPGELTPTLHNSMFRAPIFKHEPKSVDFLVIRSRTGIDGDRWHLRTVENLYVVGQGFPSVEVPGVHSRKATDIAKRRLKMISYRTYKKNEANRAKGPWLGNEAILKHLPGSDIAQNRGKMREFMNYDKEKSSWTPRRLETLPDEATLRSWIKPEDVALLDAMQAGQQRLDDAGFTKDYNEEDDEGDDDNKTLEDKWSPWKLSKNFLAASKGQAMLELHGEGDPTGIGEAFSFIKTSMKGGFKAMGESIEERLTEAERRQKAGHSYNVARQQRAYEDTIHTIWTKQKQSLSSNIEPSDPHQDITDALALPAATPRSGYPTPGGPFKGRSLFDEAASVMSGISHTSMRGKIIRITRVRTKRDGRTERETVDVDDPEVVRDYKKKEDDREMLALRGDIENFQPTGDAEKDHQMILLLNDELQRLQRNKERRHVREQQKGRGGETPAGEDGEGRGKAPGTQRRCANCGQIGHIKTNKKLCPMLNGTQPPPAGFDTPAFGGSSSVAATPATERTFSL